VAVTVDPLDVEALAQAMRRVLVDSSWRDQMVPRGLEWARQFTWQRAAGNLLNVYQNLG
jgi:glycosyltransferase involved in cell wall biosynthesis